MKDFISRYKKSVQFTRTQQPELSIVTIIMKKMVHKIGREFDNLRSIFLKDSTFVKDEDLYMCSLYPKKVLDYLIEELQPKSVLDVGCGTGVSLEYFLKKGISAVGIENSDNAIKKSVVAKHIIKRNLKKALDLNRKFDLVWSFEVIEHIHPQYESIFLRNLIDHSDKVVISAATPGQGGHGHFNEQLPEYWINRFSDLNYQLNTSMTESLREIKEMHAENLLFFEKKI